VKWEELLDVAGLTDVGMRRSNNQDSFRLLMAPSADQWHRRGHVFLVADGMGAHAVGELASKMAVDTIPHTYHKLANIPYQQAIAKAVQDANSLIYNRGKANQEFKGMGTTSTTLVLLPQGAVIAHVGDSRAYRVRNGQVEQLSFDHSLAWELVRRRQLTLEQARTMVPSNVITRSLGPDPEVQVDIEGPHSVEPGDVFVLCSDGLSGQVTDPEIGALARHLPALEACQALIDMANLRGGPDNITLIIVRVGDESGANNNRSLETSSAPPGNRSARCMILGIGLVLASLLMGIVGQFTGLKPAAMWSSAAVGILLGLAAMTAGLLIKRWNEPALPDESAPPLTAYRHAPCAVDKPFLDRFIARLQQLRTAAVEKAWNVDWTEFFAHRNTADKHVEADNPTAALHELCEAQRLLAAAQKRFQEQTQELLGGK